MKKGTVKIQEKRIADELSEVDLVRAAQSGDKKAFVELVVRCQGMVTGVTLAILQDFGASEDAAQEAFVKAWQNFSQLNRPEKFRPWLSQIARSTALMHLRKRRPMESLDSVAELAAEGRLRPDQLAAFAEEKIAVLAALEKLPEKYRLPLILFYREEKSTRVVAKDLGLSESVVRKRLSRGREMLRDHVTDFIGSVLKDSLPGALFTTAVAASIGALAPPSAVAATAFSASASSSSASGAAVPLATTTMTTSKFTLTTAALISIVCLPVGYGVRMSMKNRLPLAEKNQVVATEQTSIEVVRDVPEVPESELVLEWRELKEDYGTDGEGLRALHKLIGGMDKTSLRRRALMTTLIAEWAQRDPGGIAFFRKKGRAGWERNLFMEEALKADGDAFVDGLMASGPGWKKLARHPLAKIAEHAPGRFAEVAAQVPEAKSAWDKKMREAFEIFATGRPEMAKAAAEAMEGRNREEALSGVAMAWARTDGKAAFAWAQSLEDGQERDAVARAVLLGWAKEDPAAALDRLGEVAPGGSSGHFASTAEGELLRTIGDSHFEEVLAWMKENPGKISDSSGLSGAVDLRLLADPGRFLSQLEGEGVLGPMLGALGSSLLNDAKSVSQEVWEWTLEQELSEGVFSLQKDVLYGMSWRNPQEAVSLVDEMASGEERDEVVEQVASIVSRELPDLAAFDLITKDVSPELKSALTVATFARLYDPRFVDPSAWVDRLDLVSPEKRPESVHHLADAWARTDASASLEWVESLANSGESVEGVAGVAAGWFAGDRESATAWTLGLEGAQFDAAASAIARKLGGTQNSEALRWLDQVDSVDRVYDALEVLVSRLPKEEGPETLAWIENSHLAPEQKETLNRAIENKID